MKNKPEETLTDIHRLMERSSRFHSLSGWSLVSAGICGLAGMWWAKTLLMQRSPGIFYSGALSEGLRDRLIVAATCTLFAALVSGLFFTWWKARKRKLPLWDVVFRRVTINFAIPMVTGGIFIAGMLYDHHYRFIAPACLFFYGLALVNASHYTLREIRYLGMFELLFGVSCLFSGYPLISLTLGFGVMHILYGLEIWYKKR
jgi:hypothetical protein